MTADSAITVTVPRKFWDDHEDRGCVQDSGDDYIVKRSARYVTATLHQRDVDDLLTDAAYYSDPRDLDPDCRGLALSAQATIVALLRQGCTPPPRWSKEIDRIIRRHEAKSKR